MQIDFHYYCIAVVCRAAGFNANDSLTIAYASQYTDDATESELIRIQTEGDLKFDPVRTSYKGLEVIESITWSAQKRIWIPFHFLPPAPFDPALHTTFNFVTQPAKENTFADLLLKEAGNEPTSNYPYRLCRIGVALHAYADTWAHRGFSGRYERSENDVESIYLKNPKTGNFELLGIENVLFDSLPEIGHAEAGYFADLAYQHWKYRHQNEIVERDNPTDFITAAHEIYLKLSQMEKIGGATPIDWDDLKPRIQKLFLTAGKKPKSYERYIMPAYRAFQASDAKSRCVNWQREFTDLLPAGYEYDPYAWKREAIDQENIQWDNYTEQDWAQMLPIKIKEGFWRSSWVNFHRAALHQRHLVLEHLP